MCFDNCALAMSLNVLARILSQYLCLVKCLCFEKKCLDSTTAEPPIFGAFLLLPNSWMHQDAIWYGGRRQPRRLCVRWAASPLPKRGRSPSPSPIFSRCLLWPNGWMDQDATWYRGRPRPRRHCVRRGPSPPQKTGHSPQFLTPMYCVQTAVCITIQLGTEVGLILGDCVTWGHSSPPLKGHSPPILGPCLYWPKGWMDQDATWYGGIGVSPGDFVLDGDPARSPKSGRSPQF